MAGSSRPCCPLLYLKFALSMIVVYNQYSMEALSLLPATALGYLTFRVATHPKSRIWNKMLRKSVKTKRLQIFPSLRFRVAGRTFHIHHWLGFSILLAISNFEQSGFLSNTITRGMLLGGVLQGLSLPRDHRKIIYKEPHPSNYPTI